jgi:hypothetical protein
MSLYVVSTGKRTIKENATTTLLLVTPGAVAIKVRQFDIALGSAGVAEELQFDVYRVETLGTPEGEAYTPLAADERDGAANAAAKILETGKEVFKKEPTAVKVLASYLIQPLGGLFSVPFPYGGEVGTKVSGAGIGIRAVTPVGVKCTGIVNLWFEE